MNAQEFQTIENAWTAMWQGRSWTAKISKHSRLSIGAAVIGTYDWIAKPLVRVLLPPKMQLPTTPIRDQLVAEFWAAGRDARQDTTVLERFFEVDWKSPEYYQILQSQPPFIPLR